LTKNSFALIDHLRSVDKRRIRRVFGQLSAAELTAIDDGLALYLGLGDRLDSESAPRVH
jgi:mRNA-degrading endonuclease toxin of MazEF toxin-antitoxin module